MQKNLTRISKFLSLVLRHKPETIGLSLDAEGWVRVDVLLDALNRNGKALERHMLNEVVFSNDKQRFAFSTDGQSIRANQGHSIDIDLKLQAVEPPDILFHGTATRFLDSIREDGLQRGKRHHVHLSATIETATSVGSRHGKPVVLHIAAKRMMEDGHVFYLSGNGVWLTDHVPVEFIDLPDDDTPSESSA